MDIPPSMLSFLASNPPSSPAPEDLMFFFSSPATEVEDAPIKIPALNHAPHPDPRQQQPNLDTLLQPSSPTHPVYDPQPLEILPVTLSPKLEPHITAARSHSASPSQSESYDSSHRPSIRSNKRKRTLPVMKELARNNAPDVSLTDPELVQIGAMHESEVHLGQSKELYSSLLAFKNCLAKHGYRMTALHLDPSAPNIDPSYSFDFVLNQKPMPPQPTCQSLSDDAARLSNCTSESTVPLFSNPSEDEPPRKRARTQKVETSTSTPPRLACAVCNKHMADIDTLVRHFRHAHQELKPFSCPRCKGYYSSEGTLWHHIRNVHTETPRKYKCSHCDASYDSFGAKTRHEHATHNTGTPAFVCSFKDCKRAFNFPAHLESHALQVHPGFRPFACGECGKSFPSANGLTRHCREVHIRPQAYSCSCSKSYSKRCHLKRHLLRVHGMSVERVQEEMNKQPHPGLLHIMPPGPPASTE